MARQELCGNRQAVHVHRDWRTGYLREGEAVETHQLLHNQYLVLILWGSGVPAVCRWPPGSTFLSDPPPCPHLVSSYLSPTRSANQTQQNPTTSRQESCYDWTSTPTEHWHSLWTCGIVSRTQTPSVPVNIRQTIRIKLAAYETRPTFMPMFSKNKNKMQPERRRTKQRLHLLSWIHLSLQPQKLKEQHIWKCVCVFVSSVRRTKSRTFQTSIFRKEKWTTLFSVHVCSMCVCV